MNILVTGGAGFLGSHLADRFIADGHRVTAIDNLTTGLRENLHPGVQFVEGHIAHHFMLDRAFSYAKPDVVFHCAANYNDPQNWQEDTLTNVLGTVEVLKRSIARDVQRFIYFQTSLCYGINPHPLVEITGFGGGNSAQELLGGFKLATDQPLDPSSSYAISKTAGEHYVRNSGLDWISFRLANMYGPRNLSGPVPTFYKRLKAGEPCTIADTRRDFVYISDLIGVAAKAIYTGGSHGIYHVASGQDYSIETLYEYVWRNMGFGYATEQPPEPEHVPRGEDDAATLLLDASKTREDFDWEPRIPLITGIGKAVGWYDEHGVAHTHTHLAIKG